MKRWILYILWLGILPEVSIAQYYRVEFTDKNNSPWSLALPEAYLSDRALQRRLRQSIPIDSLDLPVNPAYVVQVVAAGATLLHTSRWLNSATVQAVSGTFADSVLKLPFVRGVVLTRDSLSKKSGRWKWDDPPPGELLPIDSSLYGTSVTQVAQVNGHHLHGRGFRGEGIQIAVIDGGFYHADRLPAFDSLWINGQILGAKRFDREDAALYEGHYHGMSVLSIMGGNIPGQLIGAAPKASYWLLRSEEPATEYLIEEDHWVAAAEFADSAGVDVINTSLGYNTFDNSLMDYTYADMDGNTTFITRGANIAASRGMLVVASAGNEGRPGDSWKYLVAPSDGDSVLAVGAVDRFGKAAPFTSYGPAYGGRVKPNVAAMGLSTTLQRSDGQIATGSGTSYSAPVVAGIAACLWQANPGATPFHIRTALEQSAHQYEIPDSLLGYGIPDVVLADRLLKAMLTEQPVQENRWVVYPNPASDELTIQHRGLWPDEEVQVSVWTVVGKLVYREFFHQATQIKITNLHSLPRGLLILQIVAGDRAESVKISLIP